MHVWGAVLIGLFIAALFWAEIYFGRLNKRQMLRGAQAVLATLGCLLLYWAGLPWLEKKLRQAGLGSGAATIAVIAILVCIALIVGIRRRKNKAGKMQP